MVVIDINVEHSNPRFSIHHNRIQAIKIFFSCWTESTVELWIMQGYSGCCFDFLMIIVKVTVLFSKAVHNEKN